MEINVYENSELSGYVINMNEDPIAVGPTINDELGLYWPVQDIPELIKRVKEYLKINDIRGYYFASEVLNVPGSFFSGLMNMKKGDEWKNATPKQQVCYARMLYWMEFRATCGNNPHLLSSNARNNIGGGRKRRKGVKDTLAQKTPKKSKRKSKPRTLVEAMRMQELSSDDLEVVEEVAVGDTTDMEVFQAFGDYSAPGASGVDYSYNLDLMNEISLDHVQVPLLQPDIEVQTMDTTCCGDMDGDFYSSLEVEDMDMEEISFVIDLDTFEDRRLELD